MTDELDELHQTIAQSCIDLLTAADVDWSECRLMTQYFPGPSVRGSFRHLDDGVMAGLGWPDHEILERYQELYQDTFGTDLARFRIEVNPEGAYSVTYFYENVDGNVTWVWPDEDGYLTPAELRERGQRIA